MRSPLGLLAAVLLFAAALPTAGETVAVDVVNASRPTRCAEEDNVYVKLLAAGIRRFQIAAVLPPYISELRTDSTAPNFADCDMSSDRTYAFMPRTVTVTSAGHSPAAVEK